MSDLSQQAKSGASWLAISQIIQPAWEFVVGIVLARILTPKDFGIVAMGVIFFSLATAISNMGISNVLIQKEKLEQIYIDTSQTIAALSGVIIYFVLVLLSYFVNTFFKEPLAAEVLRVFSLNFMINGITMIPAALMTKEMRFRAISLIDILSSVIYGCSALFIAYLGYGLWSLVHSVILAALFRCVASCIVASYVPKFGWNNVAAAHIIKFGGGLTLASVLNYAARNIDFFIIGKFLGATQLGLYKRAYDLAVIPKEKVGDSLSRILFPFICKIRDDKAWTKSAFLKTDKMIGLICIPILLFMIFAASDIVVVLYGERWIKSIPPFRLMALGGIFYSLCCSYGPILLAYGYTSNYLKIQAMYAFTLLIVTLVGVKFGIEGVAISVSFILFIYLAVNNFIVSKIININITDILNNTKLSIYIGVTIVTALMLYEKIGYVGNHTINLVVKSFIATIVYGVYIYFSKDSVVDEMKKTIFSRLLIYK